MRERCYVLHAIGDGNGLSLAIGFGGAVLQADGRDRAGRRKAADYERRPHCRRSRGTRCSTPPSRRTGASTATASGIAKNWPAATTNLSWWTPSRANVNTAFDHERLAAALSKVTGKDYRAGRLPIDQLEFAEKGEVFWFKTDAGAWKCDPADYTLTEEKAPAPLVNDAVEPRRPPLPAGASRADRTRPTGNGRRSSGTPTFICARKTPARNSP